MTNTLWMTPGLKLTSYCCRHTGNTNTGHLTLIRVGTISSHQISGGLVLLNKWLRFLHFKLIYLCFQRNKTEEHSWMLSVLKCASVNKCWQEHDVHVWPSENSHSTEVSFCCNISWARRPQLSPFEVMIFSLNTPGAKFHMCEVLWATSGIHVI